MKWRQTSIWLWFFLFLILFFAFLYVVCPVSFIYLLLKWRNSNLVAVWHTDWSLFHFTYSKQTQDIYLHRIKIWNFVCKREQPIISITSTWKVHLSYFIELVRMKGEIFTQGETEKAWVFFLTLYRFWKSTVLISFKINFLHSQRQACYRRIEVLRMTPELA